MMWTVATPCNLMGENEFHSNVTFQVDTCIFGM